MSSAFCVLAVVVAVVAAAVVVLVVVEEYHGKSLCLKKGLSYGPTDGQTLLWRCEDASKNVTCRQSQNNFFFICHHLFLDASSHLYMRVCPSVRPSVTRLF